jgi:hypothetical protein
MNVLSMNLVVQSTHYSLHCDSLATVLINNLVSFVSEFLSCHFLVSAKWLFCGTEIRYTYIHHGSCDNASPVWCHSSPARRRYESIRRITSKHFLTVLWRSLVSRLGLGKRCNIHRVSEFIIRNVLCVLDHWEEWWKWFVFAECVLTTIMNNLFYCIFPDVWDICTLSRKITVKMRHPRIYNYIDLDMFRFQGKLSRAYITHMAKVVPLLKIVGSNHVHLNKIILLFMRVYLDGYFQ